MSAKEKESFVSIDEQRLKEARALVRQAERQKSSDTEPAVEEETLFTYYKEQNIQLARIADALEGKVRTEEDLKKSPPDKVEKKVTHVKNVHVDNTITSKDKKVEKELRESTESYYVKEVRGLFPPEVNELFNVTDEGAFIKIQGYDYVGNEVYARVAKVVESYRGRKVEGVKEKGNWVSYPYLRIDVEELG